MQPPAVKEGLLTEDNCPITQEQLDAIIRRGELISDHYELEAACFARGKFAQVRRITHKKTGVVFAAKSIKRRRPRFGDVTSEIFHEIRVLLLTIPCNRIVHLHEVFETRTEFILVLELAAGGELQQILDDNDCIEEQICRRLIRQIVEGVKYLHSHRIAHLDLKPQNILLTGALPAGEVLLCDFGISRLISDNEIREIMGTTDYMPPEILQFEAISLSSDTWSLGVVAYALLSGHAPFSGENSKMETYSNITSGAIEFPDHLFENVSEQAKDFIRYCLARVPSDRPTCDQCLQHDWLLTEPVAIKQANGRISDPDVTVVSNLEIINEAVEQNRAEMTSNLDIHEFPNITILNPECFEGVLSPTREYQSPLPITQLDKNQFLSCDTFSGQPMNEGEKMDISNQPLSYDSDKENVKQQNSAKMANPAMLYCEKSQLNDLSKIGHLAPFYKSHKRLSSDIFPSSDHQKLIAVVAASSSSVTTSSTLKKYTSESAMSTINSSSTTKESSTRTVFTSTQNDPNNNLMENQHSAAIHVPIRGNVSGGETPAGNGEPSPPSTPNKKIYLSIDDSFCHFGLSASETSRLMFTKLVSLSTSKTVTSRDSAGLCSRIRSVSMERLNTSVRTESSNSAFGADVCLFPDLEPNLGMQEQ